MFLAEGHFKLVGMLSEPTYSLAVRFYYNIEFLFRQNSKLTVATSNTAFRSVIIHIAVKHSTKRHSSGLKCGVLGPPHLLVDQHLEVLLDVAESSHVLLKLEVKGLYLSYLAPYILKS